MTECVVCGRLFPTDRNKKTCSPECAKERKRSYDKKYLKKWYRDKVGFENIKKCLVCGKEFEAEYVEEMCSDECREIRQIGRASCRERV